MISSLGIHHPTIRLSEVKTRATSGGAVVTYRRLETFESKGKRHEADEIGTLEMIRRRGAWRIRRWATTDVPK